MEGGTHEGGGSGSGKMLRSGTSQVGGVDVSYDKNNSITEIEEGTTYDGDDGSTFTSQCPSEAAVSATVIGYSYGLRSLAGVMPEVQAGIEENSSLAYHDSTAQECANRNDDSVSIMPSTLAAMQTPGENTQRPVYFDVETPYIENKWLNSELAEAIAGVAGDTNV
eukprot:15015726-Ditylum_brightwellii.AAC.1